MATFGGCRENLPRSHFARKPSIGGYWRALPAKMPLYARSSNPLGSTLIILVKLLTKCFLCFIAIFAVPSQEGGVFQTGRNEEQFG